MYTFTVWMYIYAFTYSLSTHTDNIFPSPSRMYSIMSAGIFVCLFIPVAGPVPTT